MYDHQPTYPNQYYWFSAGVEVSVTYHYCQKVHAVSFHLRLKYGKKYT